MQELLLKSLTISLFCVGLRIVSSKGMVLYFIRWPYDKFKELLAEEVKLKEDFLYHLKAGNGNVEDLKKGIRAASYAIGFERCLIYLLKPVIACSTCMASLWTILLDYFYFNALGKSTIIIIFVCACLNSIIHAVYDKLIK